MASGSAVHSLWPIMHLCCRRNARDEGIRQGELPDEHARPATRALGGPLEALELGPIIGRGSFGRVYKGEALRQLCAYTLTSHA